METNDTNRDKVIIRTSVIGIIANVFLAAFKAAVGLISHSVAVTLDAVNNLSDALSSVITIIGTKLAGKKPDKKHPFGYGRIEYLSAMIISAIVLYAGITSFVESVKKIITPETADYSLVSLIIIASAVVVKLILGVYVKKVGARVKSASLTASGADALFDAILSASVLVSAIIYMVWHISLEAYVGVIISVIIIKSGIEMLADTLDEILGRRLDKEHSDAIKRTVCEDECVKGAFDLILHSYGSEKLIGSIHVEVADTMTAGEIDAMQRRIANNVYQKHGVFLTGIGIYSMNTRSEEIKQLQSGVNSVIMRHDGVLQVHGFYADTKKKSINIDIILDFELDDREGTFKSIKKELSDKYPDYTFNVTMDIDV